MPEPRLMTMEERRPKPERIRPRDVALMTSLTVRQVIKMADRGEIPVASKDGEGWTFKASTIRAWIKSHETPWTHEAVGAPTSPPTPPLLDAQAIIAAAQPAPIFQSGIYFLINAGRIVYVGQALNVAARIGQHLVTKAFDAWHWVPCAPENLRDLERAYIDAFLPPLNADPLTLRNRRLQQRTNRRGQA